MSHPPSSSPLPPPLLRSFGATWHPDRAVALAKAGKGGGVTGLLLLTFILPAPAHASLIFCNRTNVPLEAAVGYRGPAEDEGEDWISEGWWKIEPGQCSRVFGQSLAQRFYFYYAVALTMTTRDTQPQVWSGKYEFCTDTKAFKITGDGNCEGRGYITKPFQQLDLNPDTRDYTLDFKTPN